MYDTYMCATKQGYVYNPKSPTTNTKAYPFLSIKESKGITQTNNKEKQQT